MTPLMARRLVRSSAAHRFCINRFADPARVEAFARMRAVPGMAAQWRRVDTSKGRGDGMSLAHKIHVESQFFPKSTDRIVEGWIKEAERIDKLLAERNTQIGVLQTRMAAMQDTINELNRRLSHESAGG